jgi:hypothetical protein
MVKTKMINSTKAKEIFLREITIGAEHDNLSQSTITLYLRQLLKLYKVAQEKLHWSHAELMNAIHYPQRQADPEFEKTYKQKRSAIIDLLFQTYSNKESQTLTLNAICKLVKNRYRDAFDYYNAIRRVISKLNKDEKANNQLTPEEEEKYISYDELMSIPQKVYDAIVKSYGKLFLSEDELMKKPKARRNDYLKTVFDYITLYLNIHYPLRLVWPTVWTKPVDGQNYLSGNKLYLNDFKNVRLMGPQVIELDQPTTKLISGFMAFMRKSVGERPEKVLYRIYNGNASPYDYSSNKTGGFSQILSRLFVKYNGKPISMNVIRHIVESHIIQSPEYATMSNAQKNAMHTKLLHSFLAANMSYNKLSNRSSAKAAKPAEETKEEEPMLDFSFEPDHADEAPEPAPVRMSGNRSRRRERIFHGEVEPRGGERKLEIDIYQS